jgi:hypothetical protein|tara:strand:+ start:178 stop:309 length:132 start_codon:yes stop_codon:yes gene_type:complete
MILELAIVGWFTSFTPIVALSRIGYGEKINAGENNDKKPIPTV